MEVKNVYQDDAGKWHIEYGFGNLMGLAIRVYFGQLLISLVLIIPLVIIAKAVSGNSLQEQNNIVPQEFTYPKPSQKQQL